MRAVNCVLVGAPVDSGKRRQGCKMGPDAYRTAGLEEALRSLGHSVRDLGNVVPRPANQNEASRNTVLHALDETVAWTEGLSAAGEEAAREGFPIFLGGDHAMSLGTVAGVAAHARHQDRPLFVLWLDAHSDIHTPTTTQSGNLHGTAVAYHLGMDGFDAFPALQDPIPQDQVCMIGLRSVDDPEHAFLARSDVIAIDMRAIDEQGITGPLTLFLDRVAAVNGMLHVSLDADFLDPSIAPAVGTTVPGGATFREAHLVMELVCDSGLATSLDLAELNPFLDERGKTATLMVDLAASLLGRRVFDRPT
ncbi:MAG: arginase [Pseudomonadota bacterium]